jgi:hypothetical protein
MNRLQMIREKVDYKLENKNKHFKPNNYHMRHNLEPIIITM